MQIPDLIYVALFAAVGPLIGYAVYWPAYHRLAQADPAWARWWLWASTIGEQWMLVAFGAAIWMASARSWNSLGFTVPDGWRLWTAIALVLSLAGYYVYAAVSVVRSAETKASLLQQVEPIKALMPRTPAELCWFGGVSLTAGFCEEFLYRGYFIWVCAPWLGWWGAAVLSLSIFAVGHIYQGWSGVFRTGIVGAVFTLTVAIFGSLWPAIALHALVDLGSGTMVWLALRDEAASGDATHGARARE
jgi:hypothetical protein